MSQIEERIKKFYYEERNGVSQNHRSDGLPVTYKKKKALAYFYIKNSGETNILPPKFKEKVVDIFRSKKMEKHLISVDYAQTLSHEKTHFQLVEWTRNLELRSAVSKWGLIKRVMRLKTYDRKNEDHEFHILLERHFGKFPIDTYPYPSRYKIKIIFRI